MNPEDSAEIAKKYAGIAGKTRQSVLVPEAEPADKTRLANQTLAQTDFLSQEAYFNPDRINEYGRRDAGPGEVELYDPDTRMGVARVAREPKNLDIKRAVFWQSSNYNPDLDYDSINKGNYFSLVDPTTGKEVARMVSLTGGADDTSSTPHTAEGDSPPENPFDQLSYVDLEQTLAQKQAALVKTEQDMSTNPLLARLPRVREGADKLRVEISQIKESKSRLLTEDEEAIEIFPDFDTLVEQEVDYRLREGQPMSTAAGPEKEDYDRLQSYLQAETDEFPNVFTNPRLKGAINARYEMLTKEFEQNFPDQLTRTEGPAEPSSESALTPFEEEQLRLAREQMEAQERHHREQLTAIESNRITSQAKEHPHDEFLLNDNPEKRRKYIESILYDYEHFANGITTADITKLKEAMTRLKIEKELIDVIDARKMLQEAQGFAPVEGSINIDKWEESMKGLFVAEGYYFKLLFGEYYIDRVTGKAVTDEQEITNDQMLPEDQRKLEKRKNIPGLSIALKILQTQTHEEDFEVEDSYGKRKIRCVANFFQGESSASNAKLVKSIYQEKLEALMPHLAQDKQAETAIHIAERILRVTLVGARMNGPLQRVENYSSSESRNLAKRRIDLSLTNDKEVGNNSVKLVNDVAIDSEWDKIYRGTHSRFQLDIDGKVSGPTKGRGTAFREILYFPAFLMQRNVGGFPELRRLANLRASDFLSHFSDAANGIDAGVGEVVDFDKFIKVYSEYSFPNKQNVLNFWVDNVKNAMDKRSLFYAEPKESGKSITGLVADPVPFDRRKKMVDLNIDYVDTKKDGSKNESDARTELEKYQNEIISFANEFASRFFVVYPGLPKDKAKSLIWLEQQFYQFITNKSVGEKYFHHSSTKRKGEDIIFYLRPKPPGSTRNDDSIGADAFSYGFYKNDIFTNINQETDEAIFKIRTKVTRDFDPRLVPTGKIMLANSGHPVTIGLKWLGGVKPKKS